MRANFLAWSDFARNERDFGRVVVGVDPPASAAGTCGIVACGLDTGGAFHVLGDHSVAGASPRGWAEKVMAGALLWGADRIVAEANNGGNMVAETLASGLRPASQTGRCQPRQGGAGGAGRRLVRDLQGGFAGTFPELEDELTGLCAGVSYRGPGRSPDRADAMVWAMTELKAPPRAPRVRTL